MKESRNINLKVNINNNNLYHLIFSRIFLVPLIILGLYFCSFISPKIAQAGFGVTPSDIINDHLKRGDHYEKQINITRINADEELLIKLDLDLNEVETWFTFEPGSEFIMPAGANKMAFKAIIDVPSDADFNRYGGVIKVKATPTIPGPSGVSVITGAQILVDLITTDLDITSLLIRAVNIDDVEEDPLILDLLIENTGNVYAKPTDVWLEVYDLNRYPLNKYKTSDIREIAPGVTENVEVGFNVNLAPGEYIGIVKVYLGETILREEEVIFRYKYIGPVDKPQVEETPEYDQEPNELLFGTVKNRYAYYLDRYGRSAILLLIILILVLIDLYLMKKNKDEPAKAFKISIIVLTITIFILLTFIIFQYFSHIKYKRYSINPSDEIFSDQVKGTNDSEIVTSGIEITNEFSHQSKGEYPIYKNNNRNSGIIYIANDGEEFEMVEKVKGWVKVKMSSGYVGWLEPQSIKVLEIE